ncbi:proprotein convertase subtilisin/kexin type 7-like [Anneissia japonica]|uniref:proprotein convertase subtilisin/kexin type 7-like n=1 Tax=Anneissia japonica TaxID=1529436 RepID=UPI0014259585|nr:proprotein convertase subtilisin/kexin type 7-like [Anneissia japonica]
MTSVLKSTCFLQCQYLPTRNQAYFLIYVWLLQVHIIKGVFLNYVPEQGAIEVTEDDLEEFQEQEVLSWAVKIKGNAHRKEQNRTDLDEKAELISLDTGLLNYGQVGELAEHYLFVHENYNQSLNRSLDSEQTAVIRAEVEQALQEHEEILWFIQQAIRKRTKREFHDPGYVRQWHLHNHRYPEMDINVTKLWEYNITGIGVVIAVIDDGLEWSNPDIEPNYCPEGSWDLNSNDADPSPESSDDGTKNRHGTRCAGEIAAAANDFCAVGVAFNSRISGVRLLDGPMTDSLEATAFNKFMQTNDIYSCSWGPDDDGKTIDGPHPLAQTALKHGVSVGRKGYGSIFVVASGNGGKNKDNCNFDGYANSIYTVTIGAIDERGRMPYYAEECAAMLAVTFSSGSGNLRSIVTTDWTSAQGNGCTNAHTGTSAAAPLAAGIIGLMLQARHCLTWRDIQHIIVFTSVKVDEANADWFINRAGFHHSHKHGFGLLNAWRLVNAARVWPPVPWMTAISSSSQRVNIKIPAKGKVTQTYLVSQSDAEKEECATVEHVVVTVTISHKKRGDLEMVLFCPTGTKSVIGARRIKDLSSDGFKDWSFSTVRCWGEKPFGAVFFCSKKAAGLKCNLNGLIQSYVE